jgi:peptide/nickel transport system substrate-binding protein
MRRRGTSSLGLAAIVASAAAITLVACTRSGPPIDILRVVAQWEPASLEPSSYGYVYTRMHVAETLVDTDEDGHPAPGLAERWTESDDGLRWTFFLRGDVRFHDGTPMHGAEVARVIDRARKRAGSLALAPIDNIQASGDVVVIILRERYGFLPALLAHSSAQILAPSAFGGNGAVTAVIGTGPYRITRITPPQSFDVELSPHWRGPQPAITSASYLAVGRAETRALMARAGQADLVFNLDARTVERLLGERPQRVQVATTPRTVILKLNAGHPLLTDARVRLALSLAIDRVGIAGGILRDSRLAASQLLPASLPDWHLHSIDALRTDPERARQILASLGWTAGANGVLEREGRRFSLEMRIPTDRPELPVVAAALQEQLRRVGVEIRIVAGNSADIPLMHHQGTLETGLGARNYATFNDPGATLAQDYSDGGGDWGAMNWPELGPVANALRALSRTHDGTQSRTLRAEIVSRLQAGLPVIPVAWYKQGLAVSDRIAGASLDPLERSYRLTALTWTSPSR